MKTLFRTVLAVALAAASLASVTGCDSREVAATVNGVDIYVEDIDVQLDATKEQYPQMFEGADAEMREIEFQTRILDNLVIEELVTQAAEDEGIEISSSDVDEQLDEIKGGFPDEASYASSLDQVGMTEEDLVEQIETQLLMNEILEMVSGDIEITEADIEAYYAENEASYLEPAAKKASHILFAIEDEATANQVYQELVDGADFGQAATQYSIDEGTAEQGGDLGWPSTPYVAEFQAALDLLALDEISEPVESVFGWHIITVTESREERVRTLEEAAQEIEQVLQQQQQADVFQVFVDELRAEAEIEYFVDYAPAIGTGSDETTSTE